MQSFVIINEFTQKLRDRAWRNPQEYSLSGNAAEPRLSKQPETNPKLKHLVDWKLVSLQILFHGATLLCL